MVPEGAGAQGIDKADVWVAFRPPQAGARLFPAWLWAPSLWPWWKDIALGLRLFPVK